MPLDSPVSPELAQDHRSSRRVLCSDWHSSLLYPPWSSRRTVRPEGSSCWFWQLNCWWERPFPAVASKIRPELIAWFVALTVPFGSEGCCPLILPQLWKMTHSTVLSAFRLFGGEGSTSKSDRGCRCVRRRSKMCSMHPLPICSPLVKSFCTPQETSYPSP